ncbi:hypothetical protein SAMN04488104_100437 [Algoriphagus faecimaris]|uniref:Uncharacterized protein n=1 Tax=Algoriphagus faecimaris TaxID=686796 RepID=A0A1G6NRM8_9BACT|nr:hypothetical protein SAMN04488104_100437 [Algoriphagus faecimaris]
MTRLTESVQISRERTSNLGCLKSEVCHLEHLRYDHLQIEIWAKTIEMAFESSHSEVGMGSKGQADIRAIYEIASLIRSMPLFLADFTFI